jgi:hypothetical protein
LLGNMTVDIKGTEVNQRRCWIRALEHDSTRWVAWFRLGNDLARSGSDSRAIIRGKTYSAMYCFARVATMENSTVQCGQRGDAWLQRGFRQLLDKGRTMKATTIADTHDATWRQDRACSERAPSQPQRVLCSRDGMRSVRPCDNVASSGGEHAR